jgi:hypothetical protein
VDQSTRQGVRRYIVRLPSGRGGRAHEPGFPVWDTSLRRVRKRFPRAEAIWRATEDRPRIPPRLVRTGRLVRRGAASAWRWTRNRDAKPW